jgi:hypothetical protein
MAPDEGVFLLARHTFDTLLAGDTLTAVDALPAGDARNFVVWASSPHAQNNASLQIGPIRIRPVPIHSRCQLYN